MCSIDTKSSCLSPSAEPCWSLPLCRRSHFIMVGIRKLRSLRDKRWKAEIRCAIKLRACLKRFRVPEDTGGLQTLTSQKIEQTPKVSAFLSLGIFGNSPPPQRSRTSMDASSQQARGVLAPPLAGQVEELVRHRRSIVAADGHREDGLGGCSIATVGSLAAWLLPKARRSSLIMF